MNNKLALAIALMCMLCFGALAFGRRDSKRAAPAGHYQLRVVDAATYTEAIFPGGSAYRWKPNGQADYTKACDALLEAGWEPFAAGMYTGAFSNTPYVYFRKLQ
jgi:hypothetical protein